MIGIHRRAAAAAAAARRRTSTDRENANTQPHVTKITRAMSSAPAPTSALTVLGMGNPLLDISCVDADGELLRAYDLKLNNAILGASMCVDVDVV